MQHLDSQGAVAKSKVLRDYLDELLSSYYYIDFRGIAQLERFISLELDEVFVPLKAIPLVAERADGADLLKDLLAGTKGSDPELMSRLQSVLAASGTSPFPTAENDLFSLLESNTPRGGNRRALQMLLSSQDGGQDRLQQLWAAAKKQGHATLPDLLKSLEMIKAGAPGGEPEDFGKILAKNRQFVLVGDPGAGKTTLLKWLARTYALGPQAVFQRLGTHEDLVPIVISVARYAHDCAEVKKSSIPIGDYIEQTWNQRGNGLGSTLRNFLDAGQALLLFDGLDEVPDMQARWTASRSIESCLRACAEKGSNGSRCMVTSRKYGYELCRLHDCPHWELAAFGPQQIEKFIHGWCRALEKSLHPDAPQIAGAEQEARELAAAINDPGSVHHDSLQGFVQNPLLLTIVALVRWQYRILPERRARLYELALTTLIETWNRMRSLNGRIEGVELDARETMELWEPVALWMHRQYPGGTAHRSEILAQLAGKLAQDGIPRDAAIQTAESYLDSAARWAGLLVERGPNAFGFVHQTFQEYLSARALVRSAQNPYEQLKTYFFDPRWHEIILLAAGFLGEVQGRSEDCTALVERIRDTTDALEPMLHRYLLLAADVVADRAPVSLRCHGETLLRLMEKCPAAVHDAKLANSFRNTIASLCWLEPDDRILKKAKALLQKEESLSWKSRAALMLLGSRMPAKAVGLLNLGLKDSDTDVRGLAAALMLRAASSSVREFASLLKPRWYETGARVLDRKAEQILLESLAMPEVVQYFVELLKDKESEVRVRAAAALQAVRPLSEAEQSGLVELLKDKNAMVRVRAAAALQAVRPLSEAAQSGLVELLKDKESEVRARAAAALARALAELLKQGSEPPAWLATRTHISVARSAVPPILAGDAKPASLRELLERALTGSNSEKEAACQDLGRQLGAGSASFPPTVAELLSELQDRRFSEGLGSAGPTETKLRNLLAVALRTRLHDLARRSRASGVSSARSDAAFLQALPAALLPQVVDGELEELSDELKKAALSRLVEQDFDRLAPELQRVVLGLYDRLRTLAGPAEMQRILRRISRAYDADEAETRAYACRSLAVFLPDLNAKERRRCFEQLLEAARGDDQEMKEAAVESLLMIQGHLSKPERASVQEARLV